MTQLMSHYCPRKPHRITMSLAEEIRSLRSEAKRLNKENKRLQDERDFSNEAAAFFAASRRNNAQTKKPNGITNELFYSHGRRSTDYTTEQLKIIIWRCYMSCWNNRRICSPIALLLIIFE